MGNIRLDDEPAREVHSTQDGQDCREGHTAFAELDKDALLREGVVIPAGVPPTVAHSGCYVLEVQRLETFGVVAAKGDRIGACPGQVAGVGAKEDQIRIGEHEQAVDLLACFDNGADMIMKATAYTFSKGDRADQIQRLSEDLELFVCQAIFGAHMSCQLLAWLTTACHVVEATRRDIELGAADRTRTGRVLSYSLQDLIAPLLVPERRTNIPGRWSQPVSSVELDGLLCRAGPLGARRRTVVARLRNLAQNLLLRRKPLGPARHKPDPGNLAAANENITQRYCVLSVMGSPFPILIQFFHEFSVYHAWLQYGTEEEKEESDDAEWALGLPPR